MTRRTVLMALLAVAFVTTFSGQALAGGWTVYIYNVRRPSGGIYRAGVSYQASSRERQYTQVYTTEAECKRGIAARVAENKKWRTDFEDYAIVYHNSRPPEGQLRSFVKGYWQYRPSNGRYR
ncbi:MAG: hypothetical protein AB7O62_22775 [Pirellulales bacterium]